MLFFPLGIETAREQTRLGSFMLVVGGWGREVYREKNPKEETNPTSARINPNARDMTADEKLEIVCVKRDYSNGDILVGGHYYALYR